MGILAASFLDSASTWVAVLWLAIAAAIGIGIYRSRTRQFSDAELTGPGGWLSLLGLGLVGGLAEYAFRTYIVWSYVSLWDSLVKAGFADSSQSPSVPAAWYCTIWHVVGAAFVSVVLYQFFTSSSRFPSFAKAYIWFGLFASVALPASGLVLFGVNMFDSSQIARMLASVVICAVWIPYLNRSRRVRNTFTSPGLHAQVVSAAVVSPQAEDTEPVDDESPLEAGSGDGRRSPHLIGIYLVICTLAVCATVIIMLYVPYHGGEANAGSNDSISKGTEGDISSGKKIDSTLDLSRFAAANYLDDGLDHIAKGQFEEARQAFDDAKAIVPDNPIVHYGLGVVYAKTGHAKEALAEYTTLKPLDSSLAKKLFDVIYPVSPQR